MSTDGQRTDHPYVVAHVAVSVTGTSAGFAPDVATFYRLASTWKEDVTLAGSDTILAQEQALGSAPRPGPAADGPLLAVVDGRGRVSAWEALREVGHWSDVLALHATATPPRPPDRGVQEYVAGTDRVDLAAALTELGRRDGVEVVRVDSGGVLVGALLTAGLLDEISLLVHPVLPGEPSDRYWYGAAEPPAADLELVGSEPVGDGLVWSRYRVSRRP